MGEEENRRCKNCKFVRETLNDEQLYYYEEYCCEITDEYVDSDDVCRHHKFKGD